MARLTGPMPIDLPFNVDSAAFDSKHGCLSVIGSSNRKVFFATSAELIEGAKFTRFVELAGRPRAIVAKSMSDRSLFVVLQEEPNELIVLDANAVKVVQSIPLPGKQNSYYGFSTGKQADDPYVYISCLPESSRELWRINILEPSSPAIFKCDDDNVASSADGKIVYVSTGGSPKDVTAIRAAESDANNEWETVGRLPGLDLNGPPIVDPQGRWIVFNRDVYSPDLSHRYISLPFRPVAFLPQSPWLAGLNEDDLVIASVNDGKIVETFPTTVEETRPGKTAPRRRLFAEYLHRWFRFAFVDAHAQTLVALTSEEGAIFPLPVDKMREQPTFMLKTLPPKDGIVGEPYSCSLLTTAEGSTAELVRGPHGALLQDNVLTWTPTVDTIGEVEFEVSLQAGGATHNTTWKAFVEHQRLNVPFAVLGCDADDAGKRAIVWGVDFLKAPGGTPIDPLKETRMGIVDLSTRQVTAERTVPLCVEQAEINATGIYLKSQSDRHQAGLDQPPMQLARLSAETLETVSQTAIQPGWINSLGDKYLDSATTESVARYSLPELNKLEDRRQSSWPGNRFEIAGRCADGWIVGSALWDDAITQPKLMLAPLGYAAPPPKIPGQLKFDFYPVMRGYQLYSINQDDTLHGYQPYSDYPFPPFIPAKLKLDADFHWTLDLIDLNSRKSLQRIDVAHSRPDNSDFAPLHIEGRERNEWVEGPIDVTPELILVKYQGRVLTIPVPPDLPKPFRIEPQQATFTLALGGAEKVRYFANGAKGFRLSSRQLDLEKGSELQSDTGEFTLAVEEHLPQLIADNVEEARRLNSLNNTSPDERVKLHIRRAREEYREMFGAAPSGVPVSVEVTVQANGPDLEMVFLQHYYLVIIPEAVYLKHVPPDPNAPLTQTARPSRANEPNGKARPRPDREPLKSASAAAYSAKWRAAAGSAPEVDLDAARREVDALNRRFEAGVAAATAPGGARQWSDAAGKKMQAALIEVAGEAVVLTDENGRRLTIPLARLSEEDQSWVKANPPAAASREARVVYCLRQLGSALVAHAQRQGSLPPARLLDERGKPLLSWRVLILRELGYEQLAKQFRYDEPWDSQHNRSLIEMMPAVFDNGSGAANQGKTAFVTITAAGSCLSSSRAMMLEDIRDPREEAAMVVEAVDAANVAWTQPVDPTDANLAKLEKLLTPYDGEVKVLFSDNSVGTAPQDMPIADWRRLVNVNDDGDIETTIKREP